MRLLNSALVVAALAFTAPAWAHGGHGNHNGWDKHHHHQHGWHHKHHRHHHRHGWAPAPRYYYNQHYYPAYSAPVYPVYAAPAPGVHIVMPNVYIPLR